MVRLTRILPLCRAEIVEQDGILFMRCPVATGGGADLLCDS